MIFSDLGVHPTAWGYGVYDDLIQKLVARGIPRPQIASIGDADSDAKKQALFEKVRSGQVRVLLGSTTKMGTGTNVQERLVALHHLDAPWKPAEVEQRDGRILRQGNDNPEVAIYRYVTEGSFDSFLWQALETKARFISQVMAGQNGLRRADDIGGQELSYAEVKAIASGNPAVLTLAEADAEIQRLNVLKKNHSDEQFLARRSLKQLPETIQTLTQRLANLTADMQTAAAHADDPVVIGGQRCLRDNVRDVLGQALDSLPRHVSQLRRFSLGTFRGLRFGIALHPHFPPEVYLEGAATRLDTLSHDHHGPRAILNAVERLAGNYRVVCNSVQQELAIAESQLRDYEVRVGAPFAQAAYINELTALRDRLKAGLSGTAPQPDSDEVPIAELAERIKSLKDARAIEATPERASTRGAAAEEPVTARIRRLAVAQSTQPQAENSFEEALARSGETFQERVSSALRERDPAL
jgi:hypothetical protein